MRERKLVFDARLVVSAALPAGLPASETCTSLCPDMLLFGLAKRNGPVSASPHRSKCEAHFELVLRLSTGRQIRLGSIMTQVHGTTLSTGQISEELDLMWIYAQIAKEFIAKAGQEIGRALTEFAAYLSSLHPFIAVELLLLLFLFGTTVLLCCRPRTKSANACLTAREKLLVQAACSAGATQAVQAMVDQGIVLRPAEKPLTLYYTASGKKLHPEGSGKLNGKEATPVHIPQHLCEWLLATHKNEIFSQESQEALRLAMIRSSQPQ